MSAPGVLVATVAASVAVILVRMLPPPTEPVAPPAEPFVEAPWLTPAAAAQIIAPDGALGPLFAGVELGGPAPAPAVRARIEAFARAHHVTLRFEILDGELAAVRFAVTYPGCCGYEGADVLALRLHRPKLHDCCGCDWSWVDDWTSLSADGRVHVRARVRVNRVEVRWAPALDAGEVIARAEALLGQAASTVRRAAGDRWIASEDRGRALLELPHGFASPYGYRRGARVEEREDLGARLVITGGRIAEVHVSITGRDDAQRAGDAARARWGRPRVVDGTWTWRTRDREITADVEAGRITLATR